MLLQCVRREQRHSSSVIYAASHAQNHNTQNCVRHFMLNKCYGLPFSNILLCKWFETKVERENTQSNEIEIIKYNKKNQITSKRNWFGCNLLSFKSIWALCVLSKSQHFINQRSLWKISQLTFVVCVNGTSLQNRHRNSSRGAETHFTLTQRHTEH